MSTDIVTPSAAGGAPATVLDGQAVLTSVPLGTLLRYFDGEPCPPARFTRKLSAWKNRNGNGRLIEKSFGNSTPGSHYPATFTLHLANYGSGGVIALIVNQTMTVTTELRFEVIEQPAPGMVRVLSRDDKREELHHLAENMAAAEAWMASNRYLTAVVEIVGEEGAGADPVGRAA